MTVLHMVRCETLCADAASNRWSYETTSWIVLCSARARDSFPAEIIPGLNIGEEGLHGIEVNISWLVWVKMYILLTEKPFPLKSETNTTCTSFTYKFVTKQLSISCCCLATG